MSPAGQVTRPCRHRDAVGADAPDLAPSEELAAEGVIEPGRAAVQQRNIRAARASRTRWLPSRPGIMVWTIGSCFASA
jgi:hypothetical protein